MWKKDLHILEIWFFFLQEFLDGKALAYTYLCLNGFYRGFRLFVIITIIHLGFRNWVIFNYGYRSWF
jgi:hypothetical protein